MTVMENTLPIADLLESIHSISKTTTSQSCGHRCEEDLSNLSDFLCQELTGKFGFIASKQHEMD